MNNLLKICSANRIPNAAVFRWFSIGQTMKVKVFLVVVIDTEVLAFGQRLLQV